MFYKKHKKQNDFTNFAVSPAMLKYICKKCNKNSL